MFPSEHTLAPQPEPFLTTRLQRSDAILGQEPILVQSRRISQRSHDSGRRGVDTAVRRPVSLLDRKRSLPPRCRPGCGWN